MSDSTTYQHDYQHDYQLIAAAIAWLEENRLEQPSLDDLAAHLAISPFHLQRLFKRWAGISPKRFVQFLTIEHAKGLLAASHSLLDAAYASGLSGPSRLHDLFVNVEAMTPGEFKQGGKGLTIRYGVHATPFGDCLLAVTGRGVCDLNFLNGGGVDGARQALHERWPAAQIEEDCAATAAVAARIFTAAPPRAAGGAEPLPVLLAGTNFQIKVWEALLRIPPGQVCTYEDVAQSLGQPTAARAVGGAVGANHIAYLIPCHRVIRKSGVIQDYRWGSTRKKAMLGWEAAQLEAA
jgi:AraC family transcriptional regulator of adaptative response/methylated-DNA-[protein]-cysteine methyltransferase